MFLLQCGLIDHQPKINRLQINEPSEYQVVIRGIRIAKLVNLVHVQFIGSVLMNSSEYGDVVDGKRDFQHLQMQK